MNMRFIAQNGWEVLIRSAQVEDAAGIIETVNSEAVERSFILIEKIGKTVEAEKKYLEEFDSAHQLFLVAAIDDLVVGCLAAYPKFGGNNPSTLHVLEVGIHIRKGYRNFGIGTQLLEAVINWSAEKGFKKINARIFTCNERSLRLFRKEGFVEEGIRRSQYRIGNTYIDEVLLGRILG